MIQRYRFAATQKRSPTWPRKVAFSLFSAARTPFESETAAKFAILADASEMEEMLVWLSDQVNIRTSGILLL